MKASSTKRQFANGVDIRECWADSTAADIIDGLQANQKYIPSKYFYDATGSELFELICELPEYYQTRTELELLTKHATEVLDGFGPGNLIELGSGSNKKIRIFLDALGSHRLHGICYIPVDVCHEALVKSSGELQNQFPDLNVQPLIGDLTKKFIGGHGASPKLILFFGSTIGNLDEDETDVFLKNIARSMNPGDRFLVGLDMVKSIDILEAAYNDSLGVTARFNKNILKVINREIGAEFEPDLFKHLAYFNEQHCQIEMHLVAKEDHLIRLTLFDISFLIRRGETIRTEICRKFGRDSADQMFRRAGMRIDRWYSDPNGWFSLVEVVRAPKPDLAI